MQCQTSADGERSHGRSGRKSVVWEVVSVTEGVVDRGAGGSVEAEVETVGVTTV